MTATPPRTATAHPGGGAGDGATPREKTPTAAASSVLDREMYTQAAAAKLLGVPPPTLNLWLEGGVRRGNPYRPIIRPEPRGGHAPVTWAEFVEAGLLREFRGTRGVPAAGLRAFVDGLRERFETPHPFADRRPFAGGRSLVVEAQDAAALDAEFCLIAAVRDRLILTPPADSFLNRVAWRGDAAAAWRPHDPRSPVLVDPDVRSGRPAVGGISTEILWEHVEGGEDLGKVAAAFGVTVGDVRWALAYETSVRTA
jgi:uncharacterized protein (DUF433 family)